LSYRADQTLKMQKVF